MGSATLTLIPVLLWLCSGALCAWLSLRNIQSTLANFGGANATPAGLAIIISAFIRVLVIGFLLFLSIKMNIVYALLFTAAFTASRGYWLYHLAWKTKKDPTRIQME